MQDPCVFRYIHKGRTFCAVAIRERRYTTTEVVPSACAGCSARKVLARSGCAHLNLGVEVDQYGGSHDVGVFYASCEVSVERLMDFERCGPGLCPHWEPLDPERVAEIRQQALSFQRESERQQGH